LTIFQKKQEEIMAPIFEKLQNAIKEVGAEKGFTYILDESTQVILYHAPSAVDAEPLVRAKLGLAKKQ
jgi:outer membrane protein